MACISDAPASPEHPGSLAARISRIYHVVNHERFPSYERAALKRYSPGRARWIEYYRFWPRWMSSDPPPDAQADDWALILFGLTLGGSGAHRTDIRFGTALTNAGYSESRLERLLSVDDSDIRRQLFVSLVRFMAGRTQGFDWTEGAAWLLSRDEARDTASRRIARDFYRPARRSGGSEE